MARVPAQSGTRCSGVCADGERCCNVHLSAPEPWFCRAHTAQAGLRGSRSAKAIQSAVVPGWIHDRANGGDPADDEPPFWFGGDA